MSEVKRVKHTSERMVGNVSYVVESIEVMEYSGEWISAGYEVWSGGISKRFIGYPTNADLRAMTDPLK